MGMRTSLFLNSKEPLCKCIVRKVSLILRMSNIWSLSFIWAGLSSSLAPAVLEYLSIGDRLQLLCLEFVSWDPSLSCIKTAGNLKDKSIFPSNHEFDKTLPHGGAKDLNWENDYTWWDYIKRFSF